MELKNIKIFAIIIFIIAVLGTVGSLYYIYTASFDNKKQYMLAENLYTEKQYQEAYAAFLKIKYFSKYYKAALLKQALSAEKLDDWVIAENKYEAFCNKYKDTSFYERARYSLGKAYYKNKKFEKAEAVFNQIKQESEIDDYKYASCYFLGKIKIYQNQIKNAKEFFSYYLKNAPAGTYALAIAYDMKDLILSEDEAVIIAKIFLANQLYDEAIVVLKDIPVSKCWTYLAIAYYNKNDIKKFNQLTKDGYEQKEILIKQDDFENFTAFYLSLANNYRVELEYLISSSANQVIGDFLLYKKAAISNENDKIEIYKNIVKTYPKSKYIPECLVGVFFDYAKNNKLNAAIKIGEIYFKKFPGKQDEACILFWTAKFLQQVKRYDDAVKYFNMVCEKYPDSYYAYRASVVNTNQKLSWDFTKTFLPAEKNIQFPISEIKNKDLEFVKLLLELEDRSLWEEIPFENLAVLSWHEYKKGNTARSIYLADRYIKEFGSKLPYNNVVWNLAFPIHYSEEINSNCKLNKLDPFLVLSLIREESHFIPTAKSSSDAIGLMQLLLSTAGYIAEKIPVESPTESKLQNPEYNIMLGTKYFAHVLDITGNNVPMFAVGGYNGGPNAMNKWKNNFKTDDLDEFVENIPYLESKNYIKKVYRSRYNYYKIYGTK